MATVKRYPFELSRGAGPGPAGEVWTAALQDGRAAVVLYGESDSRQPAFPATVAARLARAGYAAVACAAARQGREAADLVAVCDALARGDLVPGLAAPAGLVVLGYESGAEPARAYVARHATACWAIWRLSAGESDGERTIEAEMVAPGSHVVERSLQQDEALDGLLAWLARVT